jgi:hypothetical protein
MSVTSFWQRLRGRGPAPASRASPATPASRAPAGPRPDALRCVVLQEGLAAPSTDYLLVPWLEKLGLPQVLVDIRSAPPPGVPRHGDLVVVSRYLTDAWRKVLAARRSSLAGLVYFMDDDLFDPSALADLAPPYARKLRTLATAQRGWLEANADAFWVSTPALAEKYVTLSPTLLPLAPSPLLRQPAAGAVRIGYHGTASHRGELEWLHGVMTRVQSLRDDTHLELFGDHPVHRRWRDIPRVAVLHPLRWDQYLAWTSSHAMDLGLAPLLPGAFNAARGAVKFYDYGRMGAVGLYADVAPYRGFIRDGVDGVLLPPEPEAWVEAITQLAADPDRRAALQAGVRARMSQG